MSDSDIHTNSCIELSEIRKLDNLLTQCETSSCENICIECCESLSASYADIDNLARNKVPPGSVRCNQNANATLSGNTASNLLAKLSTKLNRSLDKHTDVMETHLVNTKSAGDESGGSSNVGSKCNSLNGSGNEISKKKGFESKRYFSLDKDRSDKDKKTGDRLGNHSNDNKLLGGSENILSNTRKHCSFDRSVIVATPAVEEVPPGCETIRTKLRKCSVKSTSICICDNCAKPGGNLICIRSPGTTTTGAKKSRDSKSTKSSQNSLKDNFKSGKSSLYDISDKDSTHESLRSKFSPQALARKISGRTTHDHDHDIADKEALLGHRIEGFHHEKKLPEPVETVRVT
ncbi:unnamed protein product [Hermetia illucens]|uniref:Uncharacterized protein n=1 Tax=Hermetia illucens TaxID=343691 RepID=A0A7R8YM59_HERIL|nr:unnamed protein product [Hermetia illucens]